MHNQRIPKQIATPTLEGKRKKDHVKDGEAMLKMT